MKNIKILMKLLFVSCNFFSIVGSSSNNSTNNSILFPVANRTNSEVPPTVIKVHYFYQLPKNLKDNTQSIVVCPPIITKKLQFKKKPAS